ncbi:nuclear transport factor 2 family protein [Shewanella baltica]|uniref:nuclear transport factor 2 family protein n=1 Tax=Shewanella baltica TaxID=62322 RepID=UPI00217D12EC|nr:nuclear transport factor 2 family protein [Shewanella baltica]MCS6161806.1 nuclear transport factor 2 family protein [Shewanella baltica]
MEDLKKVLIELEEYLFLPEVRGSSIELAQLISDDFIEIGASGLRFGKANVLRRLPNEVAPEIIASNYELRMLGSDTAQLLYKAKMSKAEQPSPVYSHMCSIWRQNSRTQWQMIYHQGTICAPF